MRSEMATICRLCLRSSPAMVPLFEALLGEKLVIEIIQSIIGMELDPCLNLPRQVCQECLKKVNLLYDFQLDLIKCQSLLSKGKIKDVLISDAAGQTAVIKSEETDYKGLKHGERIGTSNKNSSVPAWFVQINQDKTTGIIQEQITQEPISIKHEPPNSDDDEMDDDETQTHSYTNDNNHSDHSEGKPQRRNPPKRVKTIPNKCYICDTILRNKSDFKDHLESHRDMLPFKCLQCSTEENPIEAPTVLTLNKHFETHTFQLLCPRCPLRFRTSSSFVYHERIIHEKDKEKFEERCEFCGRVFNNYQMHRNHVQAHKNVILQRYKCESCETVFPSRRILTRHTSSRSCMRNIEKKARQNVESGKRKRSLGKRERKRMAVLKEVERIVIANSKREDHNISQQKDRTDESKISSPIIKTEPNDIDEDTTTQDNGVHSVINNRLFKFSTDDIEKIPSFQRPPKKPALIVKFIPNKCYICEVILGNKNDLNDHLEIHMELLPYRCTQCSTEANPIIFTTIVLLNRHFETHSFNYVCPHCPLRHRNNRLLAYHIRTTHVEQKSEFHCEICGKVFTSDIGFQNHIRLHKNMMTQRYKCETCHKHFPARYSLQRHLASHATLCRKPEEQQPELTNLETTNPTTEVVERNSSEPANDFLDQYEYDEQENDMDETIDHDVSANQSNGEESYDNEEDDSRSSDGTKGGETIPNKCYICGPILESEFEFNKHLKTHKNMLPHKCLQCSTESNPIVISTVMTLNKHFQRHDFKHVCPHCPLRYKSVRSIKCHIQGVHGDQKLDYICETCGERFSKSRYFLYRQHVNRHKNLLTERYTCKPCKRIFSTQRNLKRHQASYMCIRESAKEPQREMTTHQLIDAGAEAVKQEVTKYSREEEANHTLEQARNDRPSSITKTDPCDVEKTDDEEDTDKGTSTAFSNKTKDGETIFESKERIISQKNDNISMLGEISRSDNQSSIIKLDANGSQMINVRNSTNLLELERIDIKNEPLDSDDDD
ncbi:zinc finger protein 91-like [Toxorhynchites rutilus septentrionalis]|uniref:zinc finger protein 91-like n=1 Tax=Toxorhynchites rutilus septentrionalis TaxID=329112 RepID=UPI00247AF272|nr:zinc finger protein 91-like [Toxorhynchites rutilus septentrionalis]XP_055639623.1 zinc finger protein 91-like [Toxorhynchites rutilus septentrionalis]